MYHIQQTGSAGPVKLYCDIETNGGGSTVVKRFSYGENFDMSMGFGYYNPWGTTSTTRGKPNEPNYAMAVGAGDALLDSNQVLLGWEFSTSTYVTRPKGYVVWQKSPSAWNGKGEDSTTCSGCWSFINHACDYNCLLYTSPSPRD